MIYHFSASSNAIPSCRRWNVRSSPGKIATLLLLAVIAISTLPFLNANDSVEIDTNTTTASGVNTVEIDTNTNLASGGSDTDKSKPLIKKARSWTLFHRILTSTTSTAKIHASSLEWMRRGTINLTIFDPKVASDEPVLLEILNDEDALSEAFVDDIRTLDGMSSNATTWYQLKLVENDDAAGTAVSLLTSVPSCSVLRSNFRDEILLQFQSVRNSNIISITYIPYISRFAPKKCMDYIPIAAAAAASTNETTANTTKYTFISKISWETSVPGMIVGKPQLLDPTTNLPVLSATNMKIKPPPGYHWFPNAMTSHRKSSSSSNGTPSDGAPEEEGSEEAPPTDNTPFGFFKRYYYIFIPLMILNLINSMNPPPPASSSEQEAGSGTPGQAAAVAGTAAATAGGNGGQIRNRRGKKD